MRNVLIVSVVLMAAQMGMAQPAASPVGDDACSTHARPSFDVASVKSGTGSANHSSIRTGPDSFVSDGTVRRLIEFAYDLRDFQLSGGPGWVNDATFEVQAKIDPPDADPAKLDETGRKAWSERQKERMQSLLADRFQLKCHIATKELPVYNLVIAKGGSKLHETTAPENRRGSLSSQGNAKTEQVKATGITMQDIARDLSGELGRTVVDKTGLTGSYDFEIAWAPDPPAGHAAETDSPAGPSLFTALQEQLGLKLESAKGPVEVLVIDGIEKPGEN